MKKILYALGKRAAPTVLKTRWIYRSLTGTESEKIEAEYLMGCHLASMTIREQKLFDDPETAEWLQSLLARLSLTVVNRDRKFQVRCVEGLEPNAFALPGGFIFITRSLLQLCDYDTDETAFVLGHEMGHVLRSHSLNRLLASEVVQLLARGSPLKGAMNPAMRQLIRQLVTQGYSRRQEFEADQVGAKIVKVAGFAPEAGIRLLKRLGEISNGPAGPGSYFASHPPVAARIQRLRRVLPDSLIG